DGPGRRREPAPPLERTAVRAQLMASLPDLDPADQERRVRDVRAATRIGDEISLGRAFLALVHGDVPAHQIRERRSVESLGQGNAFPRIRGAQVEPLDLPAVVTRRPQAELALLATRIGRGLSGPDAG